MPAGIEWDARAELHLAVWIERYLAEQPPPENSAVAGDLRDWAERFRKDGERRLAVLRATRLTVA